MTDHRPTDLSYGHPGKATYEIEEKQWIFSVNSEEEQRIQQLSSFNEWVPPSIKAAPKTSEKSSIVAKSQLKWLIKNHPETFPGNEISSSLAKVTSSAQTDLPSNYGTLLAVGRASDPRRISGYSSVDVLAMSSGEVGHVLRLIRLQPDKYGWDEQREPKLFLTSPQFLDQSYWMNIGGAILQIVFAEVEDGLGTWFAVRQSTTTTIFRPCFGRVQPAFVPKSSAKIYPSSRLSVNPVAVLSPEKTGMLGHADISFNPWYCRQFSVIDPVGSWCIWDIESRYSKSSTQDLVAGKKGCIYDGYQPDPASKEYEPNCKDDWHRILWVCNINTVVVCNRRHFAVFDVKSRPTRLPSSNFLAANKSEWILEMKRNPANLNHLFILTTARVFWLEVISAEEEKENQSGVKVLLSYRHFRDPDDDTMRLTLLKGNYVSVLVSSGRSPLINFYSFLRPAGATQDPSSWQTSLLLSTGPEARSLHTISCIPATLSQNPGSEDDFLQNRAKFFQIWALASNLSLASTVCVVRDSVWGESRLPRFCTSAPTFRIKNWRHAKRVRSEETVSEPFVVPDGFEEEVHQTSHSIWSGFEIQDAKRLRGDLRVRINWRKIFLHVLSKTDKNDSSKMENPDTPSLVAEILSSLWGRLQDGKEANSLPMATLFELANNTRFSEELDGATATLQGFLEAVKQNEDLEAPSSLVLSNLTLCPAIKFPIIEGRLPELLKIYDHLVENWISSLHRQVPIPARISKYKIIRQVAIELCLSSIGVSLRSNEPQIPEVPDEQQEVDIPSNKASKTTRESSPTYFSASEATPAPMLEPQHGLPTPSRTGSVYSHTTNTSGSELNEDPATSRLRRYATFIKSRPNPGTSSLLSNWVVGGDPAEFSWEDVLKTSKGDDSGEENSQAWRREAARRRKRTEKFLNQDLNRRRKTNAESQPSFIPSGSQPNATYDAFSSQTVDNLPMTQPDRGAFGSRSIQKEKKKQKRRHAGF